MKINELKDGSGGIVQNMAETFKKVANGHEANGHGVRWSKGNSNDGTTALSLELVKTDSLPLF